MSLLLSPSYVFINLLNWLLVCLFIYFFTDQAALPRLYGMGWVGGGMSNVRSYVNQKTERNMSCLYTCNFYLAINKNNVKKKNYHPP